MANREVYQPCQVLLEKFITWSKLMLFSLSSFNVSTDQVVQEPLGRVIGSSVDLTNELDPLLVVGQVERVPGLPVVGNGQPVVLAVPDRVDGEVVLVV